VSARSVGLVIIWLEYCIGSQMPQQSGVGWPLSKPSPTYPQLIPCWDRSPPIVGRLTWGGTVNVEVLSVPSAVSQPSCVEQLLVPVRGLGRRYRP
jgi:hypothetical protein